MAPAFDDDELSLSMSTTSTTRRNSDKTAEREAKAAEQAPPVRHQESSTAKKNTISRIGAYDVYKTLGEGSFGKVKLAVHRVTKQQVALKIINRRKLVTRDMAGRIEREIQYLQLLRHPHIIKL